MWSGGPASVFRFEPSSLSDLFGSDASGVCRRLKPGVFASRCALQTQKKAKMSASRLTRVIWAERESLSAFDASRLLQPKVYSAALQTVLESHGSVSAVMGQRVFDKLRRADEVMGTAEASRNEL